MLKKSEILPQIRKQCEDGVRYLHALKNIKIGGVKRRISPQTIANWRKRPMINRYINYCVNVRDEKITDSIEDKLTERILKDKASPAEIIFYLCNRRSDKWKRHDIMFDQSTHYHSVVIRGKMAPQDVDGHKVQTLGRLKNRPRHTGQPH